MLLYQFPFTYHQSQNGMPCFIVWLMTILVLIGMFFVSIWEMLEHIFKLCASAAAHEFCEWVQVGIDVYIPHCKYQVKPDLSPLFSTACAAVIVHRNQFFFCFYQQNTLLSEIFTWRKFRGFAFLLNCEISFCKFLKTFSQQRNLFPQNSNFENL